MYPRSKWITEFPVAIVGYSLQYYNLKVKVKGISPTKVNVPGYTVKWKLPVLIVEVAGNKLDE